MKQTIFAALVLSVFVVLGCEEVSAKKAEVTPTILVIDAMHTKTPVKVDGVLDDPVWKTAKVYKLQQPSDREENGEKFEQGGEFMLAWDDKNIYIAGKFEDLDVEAHGKENGMHHYQWGDLMEVFLWPDDYKWYWELYSTPGNKSTTFFFPSPSMLGMQSCFEYKCEITIASKVNGSLNDWSDKDAGWTTEMAVPLTELTKRGEKFGPGSSWRILVARYNYGFYLDRRGAELSASSKLSKTNFHLIDEYGKINFVK